MSSHSPMRPLHTYSIVARDPATGQFGVAVQSHAFAVGPVVPWAEAGVGAVATQSLVRIEYGPEGLALLRAGRSAAEALAELLAADPTPEVRQVAIVDARGGVAVHTGDTCIAAAGHSTGPGFAVQANLMRQATVWPAMHAAYTAAAGDFAERLLAALAAAQAEGGDIRGQQSAALLVVAGERQAQPWQGKLLELRVEDHPRPVEELARLLRLARAYEHAEHGDADVAAGRMDAALAAYTRAAELAPDVVELRFWAAAALFQAGREEEALARFREVFAREQEWVQVVPRIVPLGLLPADPAQLRRITDLASEPRGS